LLCRFSLVAHRFRFQIDLKVRQIGAMTDSCASQCAQ
jgi:hypothetical protein